MTNEKTMMTADELAHVGEGALAYLREIESDELTARFPGMPEIQSGLKLWALFAANGDPILLSDERDTALAGALQNHLIPVSLH